MALKCLALEVKCKHLKSKAELKHQEMQLLKKDALAEKELASEISALKDKCRNMAIEAECTSK